MTQFKRKKKKKRKRIQGPNKKIYIGFECPLCFEHMLPPFPRPLQRLISTLKKNEEEFNREQEAKHKLLVQQCVEEGSLVPPLVLLKPGISENDQQVICRMHKVELVMKPLGIKKGYPAQIDFEAIDDRIKQFKQELEEIIEDKQDSLFLTNAREAHKELGSVKARQATSMMNRFEETLPGYYGNRGSHYIMETLNEIFLKSNYLDKSKAEPLTPIEYIQQVLVPETGVRLIKQDLKLPNLQEASKVMKESTEYGSIVYSKIKKKE
ncbi:RTC4-like domain-containing protein [Helicostylum pulchrum]|nr:RTC4-like domain-containing protein [Helicostylum pulchrum]